MRKQSQRSNWCKGTGLVAALVFGVFISALPLAAQAPPAVHGSGTPNVIPLWTASTTIGNSVLTQSGSNISLPGTLSATGFTCPACVGNAQLSINYAGSSSQGGDANNSLKLGGLSSSAFAQLGASNNSFTGNMSVGGTLSRSTVNSGSGGFRFAGTPVLTRLPGNFSLYVGQNAGSGAGTNNTGDENTATGYATLFNNTTGHLNTATGTNALFSNTSGGANTAIGSETLFSTTTGYNNTAVGGSALAKNTTGIQNTAVGVDALFLNTTGTDNIAIGIGALGNNTDGGENIAIGFNALQMATTGGANIAIGNFAGQNLTGAEINNIDIDNLGVTGESGVIRIGTAGTQTAAYIAGITGVTTGSSTTSTVLVDSNGQLGTIASSRRYKEDIRDMGTASDGLLRLRPVMFRYKKPYADGSKPIQYGLIAEEVAEIYPDLVVNGKDGQPETVQYYKLDAMLLNELQKLAKLHAADQAEVAKLQSEIAQQGQRVREQQALLNELGEQMRTLRMTLAQGRSADRNEQVAADLAPDSTKPTARK